MSVLGAVLWVWAGWNPAHALPDQEVATLGSGSVTWLTALPDARVAAWLDSGTGQLTVLDTETWEIQVLATGCTAEGVAGWQDPADGVTHFFVGCSDGSLSEVMEDEATWTIFADDPIVMGSGPVLGVVADKETVFAVLDEGDGLDVHTWSPESETVDDGGFSGSLVRTGFTDVGQTSSSLVVLHGSDDVTKVVKTSGQAASNYESLGGRNFIDVVMDDLGVLLADSGGGIVRFTLGNNEYQLLLNEGDGLSEISAIAIRTEGEETWLAVAESDAGEIWFYDYSATNYTISDEVSAVVPTGPMDQMVVLGDYLLGGGVDTGLHVFTGLPWVEIEPGSSEVLAEGDVGSLSFSASKAGSWELHLGSTSGDLLAEGEIEADIVETVTFSVDETFAEGANRLFVLVAAATGVGSDALDLVVDNPPGRVELGSDGVGFGDGELLFHFDGIEDADLVAYDVYISTVAFSIEDYLEGGGPAYVGSDEEIVSPVSFEATPDAYTEFSVGPLTNGVTYYVGLRAVDAGGLEGEMSEVLQVTPEPATGAAGLASDSGGFSLCGSSRAPRGGAWLVALSGLLVWGRRRSAALLLVLCSLLPATAMAEKGNNVEVRVGPADLADTNIQAVYGDARTSFLSLETGPQFYRVLEVDVGMGWLRSTAAAVGEDSGETSGYDTRLTLLPFSLSTTARLDLFDGQPVVPFARVGAQYWLWSEQQDTGEGFLKGTSTSGGKAGWFYGVGVNLLLDPFSQDRASQVYARWGITDSYIVIDWKKQAMLTDEDGLGFEGSVLSVGLKLDR